MHWLLLLCKYLQGNSTCFSHSGNPSVIDYLLCSYFFLDSINHFQVHELTPFSIRCQGRIQEVEHPGGPVSH